MDRVTAIAKETPINEILEQEFHPAVRLLLARMDTDPEEFSGSTRWEKPLAQVRDLCTPFERKALEEKYRLIKLDAVHVQIMKIMTNTEDDNDLTEDSMERTMAELAKIQALQAGNYGIAVGGGGGAGGMGGYGGGGGGAAGIMPSYIDAQNINAQQMQTYERMKRDAERNYQHAQASGHVYIGVDPASQKESYLERLVGGLGGLGSFGKAK